MTESVLRESRPHCRSILLLCALSLLATPLALLWPLPMKIVVDSVLGAAPLPAPLQAVVPEVLASSRDGLLALAVILVILVALLSHGMELVTSVVRVTTGEKITLGFRSRLFSHLQRLSLSYHDTRGTSDSVYRVQYDATSLKSFLVDGLVPLLTAIVTFALMMYVSLQIDWQLTMIALLIAPLLLVLLRLYRRRLKQRWHALKDIESGAMSVLHEVLSSLRVVKAFGQEAREQDRFSSSFAEGVRARVRLNLVEGFFGLLVGLTMASGTALVLYVGVRHVQAGIITLGDLLLIMGYLSQIYGPLKTIARKTASLQGHLASTERASAALDEPPDVAERADARPLGRALGQVVFRDVSFRYTDDRPILRDISFTAPPGARVGIVGRTGAGKTTLVSLLMRFHDPLSGEVLLDGQDVRDYRLADLRHQFAIVLQEPLLFSTSIGENIAYARPDASRQEVIAAARAANVDEFIDRLPEGYDTRVGERGMKLSGGERQRISIARAFLKDAPLLILDEPTSSVDTRTEAGIIEAMQRLMQGRTTFMIAHRPGTLYSCTILLVLEEGRLSRVVESRDQIRQELDIQHQHLQLQGSTGVA